MTHRPLIRAGLFAFLTLAAAPAHAQDEFRLGDDDSWLKTESLDPGSPEGQLAHARRFIAEGRFERGQEAADRWIDQHPNHPLMPEAYLIRGDARVGRKSYYKALFDYEAIVRVYPASEVFIIALEREFEIAQRFAHGTKRKLWGLRLVGAKDEAEELLIRIQERLPGSALAERAGIELGDFYFREGKMKIAVIAYDLFLENYRNSEFVTIARLRLIAAHLAGAKGPEFDVSGLYAARERLREMQVVDPVAAQEHMADAIIAGINEKDARKMLTTAKWYLRTHDPIAAEFIIRRLVRTYERSAAAVDALRLIPTVLPKLADRLRKEVEPFYLEKRRAILGVDTQTADGGDS